jgi:hypothetical protein
MKVTKPDLHQQPAVPALSNTRQEVLNADESEMTGLTRNVSASGVLFALDRELKVGLDIRFSLRMPGTVLGTPHDVLVHCTGRVVRCSLSHHQYLAASTIDEYRFAEQ